MEKLGYVKRKTYEECLKKNEELKRNIEELKSQTAALAGERDELKRQVERARTRTTSSPIPVRLTAPSLENFA
jgi:cell division septum initiation protein DivIVA